MRLSEGEEGGELQLSIPVLSSHSSVNILLAGLVVLYVGRDYEPFYFLNPPVFLNFFN